MYRRKPVAEKDCSKLKGEAKKKCLDEAKKKGKPADKSDNLPPWMKKKGK